MVRPLFYKSLLLSGAVQFLLGLGQGAAVHALANPRMALSAHLTAVQSGMALMVAGAVWGVVALRPALARLSRCTMVAGMYGLWLGLTLSAATGASRSLPIAGAGFSASPMMESVVSALVLASSIAMVAGWALLVVGLIRWRTDKGS